MNYNWSVWGACEQYTEIQNCHYDCVLANSLGHINHLFQRKRMGVGVPML